MCNTLPQLEQSSLHPTTVLSHRLLLQTTCYRPPATDHLLQTTCYRPPATDHLLQTTCYRPPATDHLLQTTCYRPPATTTSIFSYTSSSPVKENRSSNMLGTPLSQKGLGPFNPLQKSIF